MKRFSLFYFLFFIATVSKAQNPYVWNCTQDTVLNCSQGCINLKAYIPDIHTLTSDYSVGPIKPISGNCFTPPVSIDLPGNPTGLQDDDTYTPLINLPATFLFPFYGIIYNQLVIGTNGVISFDLANANQFAQYSMLSAGTGLTSTGSGAPVDLPDSRYDRAIIMGIYEDIDPLYTTSPNQLIKYDIIGTYPTRKFILSFYKVPTYLTACQNQINNSYQITLYENTGIIDVHVYEREICPGWNQGRAMIGLQNYDRDQGIMPPGRAASSPIWGGANMNEGWRFTPKGGPSALKSVQLLDLSGNVLASGDTAGVGDKLEVTFANICPAASTQYVVRSVYENIFDPTADIVGADTINVIKTMAMGSITENITQATCGTNGSITVTSPVGPAIKYSSDAGATFQSSATFSLPAGIYPVIAKDTTSGCTSSKNITVAGSGTLTADASSINTSCPEATNGTITVNASLGVIPYTYAIDNPGGPYVSSNIFNGLDTGSHTIYVKDNAGCSFSFRKDVSSDNGFTTTADSANTSCSGVNNGTITVVQPSTGSAPFTYEIPGLVPPQASTYFTNLAAASYTIKVKDGNGCSYSFSKGVGSDPGFTTTADSVNTTCPGVSNGTITVNRPSTGVTPFAYAIPGLLGPKPSPVFNGLAAGSYNINVTDAIGCTYAFSKGVGSDPGFTTTADSMNASCAGVSNGRITVDQPSIGIVPFLYVIPGLVAAQPSTSFNGLAAGSYTIQVTDAIGCSYSFTKGIGIDPGVVTAPSTIQNSSCETIPNGSITVNVTAGIAPYTYKMVSPPGALQLSNIFAGLFSGNYDISIADSAGCTATITSVVGTIPKVKIDSLNVAGPSCNGFSDGTVTVNVSLGVPSYQYAIDINPYSGNKVLGGVAAGNHTLHISDANGCLIDSAITVTEPAVLTNALVSTTRSTCSGNPDGQIVVNAAGGTLPYQYTLDAAGLSNYQPSASFPVIAGAYKVTVKDGKDCTASVDVRVDSVYTMFLDLGADTTVCFGQPYKFRPNTNPETSIFSYTPAATIENPSIKNAVANPPETTIRYKVVAQWGICTLTDEILLNVLHRPIPDAGADVVICHDTTTVLHGSASNLSGTVNYSWSPSDLLDTRADTNEVTARPVDGQTFYTLTVTDNYGCNYSVTDQVLVNMLPPVYAFAGNDTNAALNSPHQLRATGAGIGGTYEWSFPEPQPYSYQAVVISDKSIANPMVIFGPVTQPGTFNPDTNYYRLAVLATNRAGCKKSDTIKINVFVGPEYYTPTAFSPNGDGVNDLFRAIPAGVNTEYFRIYNRYGELLFETNRFMQGWDGTYRGKPQLPGAYVWTIKGKNRNGMIIEKKGTVMLVR